MAEREASLSAMHYGQASGPCIVMIHGAVSASQAVWFSPFASQLSQTHHVLTYDLRGHGESDCPASGYDLNSQADDLQGLLARELPAGTPVVLVGHSLGALIALRHALRTQSEQISGVILIDPPMPASDCVGPSLIALRDELMAVPESPSGMTEDKLGRAERRRLARTRRLLLETDFVEAVLAMGPESQDQLQALHLPVRLIAGEASPCRSSVEGLHQHMPNSSLTVLPCGHFIPTELPQALLDCLQQAIPQMHASQKEPRICRP